MPDSVPQNQPDLTAKLANARQSLALLRSQIKSGDVETEYWVNHLDEMGDLLKTLSEERAAGSRHPRLAALYEVSAALGSTLDLDKVLHQVMDAIIAGQCDVGIVMSEMSVVRHFAHAYQEKSA